MKATSNAVLLNLDEAVEERVREAFEAHPDMMGGLLAVYSLGYWAAQPAPTMDEAISALHNYQHGEKLCVQGNCRKRDTAARLAPAVLALLNGAKS